MLKLFLISIFFVCSSANEQQWIGIPYTISMDTTSLTNFINDQSRKMQEVFKEQKIRFDKVLDTSYENAVYMKETVTNYVEDQQKKMSENFNHYVETVKENGRKVTDSWSYLPVDGEASRLDNPDAVLAVPAIIARHGYPCETHTVISEGYVLNIHRIPHSKSSGEVSKKTVLLQHGLFASSADWILNGPDKGLAYTLSNAGYDVWMSNIRGNRYSKEHVFLKTDSKAYWNFSWHEVAIHDVPAVIDYIQLTKGADNKISYIGHSMGTTILFAMLSSRPEYNEILTTAIALAPVAFMSDIKSPLKNLAPMASNIAYMEMLYGSHEFIPKNSALGKLSSSCDADSRDALLCKNVIFYICGFDEQQFNKTLMPVFLAHLGTGTSWKTAVHFSQEIVAGGKFQQFDYGSRHNQIVYESDTPPEYDLSKITLPVSLFWAQNDLLSSEKDVKELHDKLPKNSKLYMVPYPEFNHLDYLWAIDANTLVNEKILETLRKNELESFSWKFKF